MPNDITTDPLRLAKAERIRKQREEIGDQLSELEKERKRLLDDEYILLYGQTFQEWYDSWPDMP
jgi:uncharacterized protein YukE